MAELAARVQDQTALGAVLETLTHATVRLVTTNQATAGDKEPVEFVEVAHEALIREWPLLRRWLDENRAGLRLHRQLAEDAREWQALARDAGVLYRGAKLAHSTEWASGHKAELNALEQEFLEASLALEQNLLEEARRRAREQERAAAALRRRATGMSGGEGEWYFI